MAATSRARLRVRWKPLKCRSVATRSWCGESRRPDGRPVYSVRAWVDERFHLDDFKALALKKKVPVHRYSYWYFLGGMTLFLFGVQVLTGGLLLLYYRPGADEAFESVQFIMTQVQFGWLIRSVH